MKNAGPKEQTAGVKVEPAGYLAVVEAFIWPVRVYYEDTDAGGVVFYANYLAYMERARTEWLRSLGFDNRGLAQEPGVVFAVRRVEIDYLYPARLDDALTVTSRVTEVHRVSLAFQQSVRATARELCRASIKLVCLDSERFRPVAIPGELLEKIRHEQRS